MGPAFCDVAQSVREDDHLGGRVLSVEARVDQVVASLVDSSDGSAVEHARAVGPVEIERGEPERIHVRRAGGVDLLLRPPLFHVERDGLDLADESVWVTHFIKVYRQTSEGRFSAKLGYPRSNFNVGVQDVKCVRNQLRLVEIHGMDSGAFYEDDVEAVVDHFVNTREKRNPRHGEARRGFLG